MASVWNDNSVVSKVHLLVLLALADHCNDDGICYPSIDRLALKTRLSIRSVHDALSELKMIGKLTIKYKEGPLGTNVYRVLGTPCTPCTVQSSPENSGTRLHPNHKEPSGSVRERRKNNIVTPPSLEEVTAYFAERSQPPIEAEKFMDFYESKGWKVGKVPMKDWKAAVRNWCRNLAPTGRRRKWEIHKSIQFLEELIARHPGNPDAICYKPSDYNHLALSDLRRRLSDEKQAYLSSY